MILNAISIRHHQSCPRRTLLNRQYEVVKHRPKQLFDASLRKGIFALSNGRKVKSVVDTVTGDFLTLAADPGLDIPHGADSWRIAKEYTSMLETILQYAARNPLLTLHHLSTVKLSDDVSWQPLAFADESGMLHRWISADSWTEDDISRELHSWETIGDIAAVVSPMMIHCIIIGQTRNGRRASPWTRGWKHPNMPSLRMRFIKQDGTPLKGWDPIYFSDQSAFTAGQWAEAMAQEGVGDLLVRHLMVESPSDAALGEVRRQMIVVAGEMFSFPGAWHDIPMHRASCDGIVPCVWQEACYSAVTGEVKSPLYRIREQSKVATA